MKGTTRRVKCRVRKGVLAVAAWMAVAGGGGTPGPVLAQVVPPVLVPVDRPCSAKTMPGGEWRSYGRDLANTRTQTEEADLSSLRAATLSPRWVFDTGHTSEVLGLVDINSTPVVARGCVYVGDAGGNVVALDATTGQLVWRAQIDIVDPGSGTRAGAVVGTVAIDGDRVIVVVNQLDGPYAVAFDARTGARLWTGPAFDTQPASYSHASPVVYRGAVFVGFSGPEGIVTGQGGFVLLSVKDGHVLKKGYTVPLADQQAGYGGGGIWSTPAIDTATGYAYVGTGNPFSKEVEHPRTNAILKIDVNPDRQTYGQVVGSVKGNIDQFLPLIQELSEPTCELYPEPPPIPTAPEFLPPLQEFRDSFVTCLQMDLDFGAAPNLFPGKDGRLLVGELQKSGVYHVVDAETFQPKDQILLGVTCLVCNAASTAYDPTRGVAYADVSPGTVVTAFSPTDGTRYWTAPVADGVHYQPLAVAAGVVYTVDSLGFLDAFDAATGLPVLRRSLVLDGAPDSIAAFASSGVSIANHTVYVAAGSRIIAYKPLGLL